MVLVSGNEQKRQKEHREICMEGTQDKATEKR